ncbi:PadR family transcriptional regulator [Lederbergia citrea]|uniref:PadR family transcriptional regulator n=1 Tax=Lederbergia citrea TaxID=2833581 RepID=A0A942Z6K8_9BACI|nr:PadR family transcriptional regulator [Lederbergia citrea]MBS4205956.1 PadR family transcriptional regulator [Lederbergia citrea]MBS4224595.1 PadR family transcriptional regulator [Lederbergia citrea]
MEERLRKLKKNKISNELQFTNRHRENIYKAIQREEDKNEDVFLAILQLLSNKKTGFELLQTLIGRGIKKFVENEGSLYLLLHELEQKEYILSEWSDDKQKHYSLNQKGRRFLKKAEAKHGLETKTLNELLRGDLLYE